MNIYHAEVLLSLLPIQDGDHARIIESSILDDEDDAQFPAGLLFLECRLLSH